MFQYSPNWMDHSGVEMLDALRACSQRRAAQAHIEVLAELAAKAMPKR